MPGPFELQGHRGARGLVPENTLPSFEVAFDCGVASIETDLHLTQDGVPVLCHDSMIDARLCRRFDERTVMTARIATLPLDRLREYRADVNPDPRRFPHQQRADMPLARLFAAQHGFHPYAIPTVADLFAFAEAYAGELGQQAGKTDRQRAAARQAWFDLELKRVPYADPIGDGYTGEAASTLEMKTLEAIRAAGVLERTRVRSFDHRCLRFLKALEPRLHVAVLIAGTAPIDPGALAHAAGADVYCPEYPFLDKALIAQAHAAKVRVLPWTVNEEQDWKRLINWGVDGITTDYPDQLAALL